MTHANKAMTTIERHLKGVIVVAAFAMVLVSVTWAGLPRVAGVVHVLDVLSE
jgi:hypothetical protein